MSQPLLHAQGLDIGIGARQLCRGLNLRMEAGQCWGLLGVNGVGKTTLLHTLAGLRAPAAGRLELQGADITRLPRRRIARTLGLLPQDNHDPFPGTVLETALMGRHPYLDSWRMESAEDLAIAQHALATVELNDCAQRPVASLSGGERRRLAIATLLTQTPDILLLDEPANHLDLHHQVTLLGHLSARAREQAGAVMMSLHDPNLASRFCDHLLMLFDDGQWEAGQAMELLDEQRLSRLYAHPIRRIGSGTETAFLAS